MDAFRHRRFLRRLAFLLIAAQLLWSAPVASAYAAIASGPDGAHCAEMMAADPADPCPCCPDAEMGVAACLSACTASVGMLATFTLPPVRSRYAIADVLPLVHRVDLADPPLKPPPIV